MAAPRLLTKAEQVRQLSPEEAARGIPVRIRGVITGTVPSPDFFVQDSSAGIYVEGSHTPVFAHHLADFVEVDGITGPGRFAPVIREQRLRVLAKGKLPKSTLYSYSELADGRMDSQWVRIRGIVRRASIDQTSWREPALAMTIASGLGQFNVRVPIQGSSDFSNWIDANVVIEGVCGSRFTAQRQLAGLIFYVPDLSFIRVETAAKPVPISSLLRFSPGHGPGHRVRVRAVVAYQQLGKALFVQSEGKGLRVLTPQDSSVQIGDVVEIIGFPELGESSPVLADAVFHRVSHAPPPAPVTLNLSLPWEQYDGTLVTTEATLLERHTSPTGQVLLLRTADWVFEATLTSPDKALAAIPLNSRLRITGICLVRSGGMWSVPQSFRVLLRSAQDVVVVQRPTWWSLTHSLWILAVAGGILLILLTWGFVLRARLREQVNLLRQKLRRGGVIEERNRIARELHDTLEQDLAGITMQLDLAVDCFEQTPEVARQALANARDMSRHSMVEARRSVWDLRCHLLETGSLLSALRQAMEPLSARENTAVTIESIGTPVRLSRSIEINLLRIAQEAVANAIKHSQASHVGVVLNYGPDKVSLRVDDDGCGFDPAQDWRTGHFGLLDMQERAQAMRTELRIESRLGSGTSLYIEVATKGQQISYEEVKANTYSRG